MSATAASKRTRAHSPDLGGLGARVMPQDADAEKGVLASCLMAPREVIGMVVENGITEEAFYVQAHGLIFAAALALWTAGKPLDFITLAKALRDAGTFDQAGGALLLNELFVFLPTPANASFYIEAMLEAWTRRKIIGVCSEHGARAYDDADTEAQVDDFETAVFGIAQERAKGRSRTTKELMMGAIGVIEKMYESRGALSGLATGFAGVDKMTDGLHGGEMIVVAARPSMGKTAFGMGIAEHVAVDLGRPVAVFSLEMSSEQLALRLVCSRARVNLKSVRDGFLSDRDFPALTAASAKLAAAPLHIDDESGLSIMDLRARARRMKAQHDVALIVIDYLQLLRSTSRKAVDNRQVEIAEISAGIKGLAKELRIPIVVLAQLNRQVEARGGGRPRMSDLRESGSIEQDADVVGLLVREEYYAEGDEAKADAAGKATLIIAKQRNGPTGDVPLTFLKEFTRFEDRAEGAE